MPQATGRVSKVKALENAQKLILYGRRKLHRIIQKGAALRRDACFGLGALARCYSCQNDFWCNKTGQVFGWLTDNWSAWVNQALSGRLP
jgi:hypothetical protein